MKFILILFLVQMFTFVESRFDVYMPTCATEKIPNQINYTLANFGHILYGRTIIGELVILDN